MALPETGSDWVEWKGGERPVSEDTRVKVMFSDRSMIESDARAFRWNWEFEGLPGDIIAYRIVKADSADDGWIQWGGGKRPVVYGIPVDVQHRSGNISLAQPAGARTGFAHDWSHTGHPGDIVAYRLAQPVDKSTPASENQNILREAETIIYGDREETYGHPAKNLESIARFWTGYLKQKYGLEAPLNPEDVCWMMALLKMSRQMNSHKRDNLVDAAGYLALIERVQGATE